MSNRFGRNQRRRARESLADREERILQLGCALDMQRGIGKYTQEKLRELEQEIQDAKEIAGNMSILFPATEMEVGCVKFESIDVPIISPRPISPSAVYETFKNIRLSVMLSQIQRDSLLQAVHLRVKFKDKAVGYAVTDSALQCRNGPQMERELMRVLPKMINQELFMGRGDDWCKERNRK